MRLTSRNIMSIVGLWILWMAFLSIVSAATNNVHMPIVNGVPLAVATVCDSSKPLLDQDTGALDAVLSQDGKFIIAYQDRAHGSLVHVVQHVGSGFQELPDPVMLDAVSAIDISPQFSPPGPKQGSVALVSMAGGKNRLYYTQRKIGDSTGPYGIWCIDF